MPTASTPEIRPISSASGAVGQVAGQIAKLRGCRVVGSAGGDAKVAHIVDTLGYDAASNYKTAPSIAAALDAHCPDGIAISFANVGGETLAAVADSPYEGPVAVEGHVNLPDPAAAMAQSLRILRDCEPG